jgi:signal transduction histidine kinase
VSKYAIDDDSSWKFKDLKTKSFTPFLLNTNLNIGFNRNATIWCIYSLKNNTANNQNTWIVFDNNHIDSLVCYDQKNIKILGDRTKYSSRFMEGQCFEIYLKPYENKQIIIKLKKQISFFEFTSYLENEKKLEFKSFKDISLLSFFFGVILLLLLFNSILFIVTKKKIYFFYILYSLLTTFYISISTSYLKNYIFTDFLYFSELRIYISCFWFVSLSIFITYFLDLKINQPKSYKIIYSCNCIIISSIIITLFLLYFDYLLLIQFFFIITYSLFAALFLLLTIASMYHIRINDKNGIYIIFAFLPQFIWGSFFLIKSFGFISNSYHYDWLVFISLYEVMLFGYVLTKNYFETFQKNNELILEVISEKEKSIELITQVQIRERRTIANIIHDNLGSKIAYVLQLLQLNNIVLANETIMELALDIREISHKILPKSLDEGAFLDSVNSHVEIINISFKTINIEFFSYDFPEKINEPWIYDLYLIVVEIINNSIKHGQSTKIIIEFYGYNDDYQFQFTDDGVGFDINNYSQGFGLENIQKRVANHNGIYEINSFINQGTILQINLPKSNN